METQVVVIGGGATGTGILRDLALRGINAVLVEKGDLANGTSARFHGLLHSGARYAVTDPASAQECIQENLILKKIAGNCIDDIGGVFLQLAGDDPAFVTAWLEACQNAGISVIEKDVEKFLRDEPNVSPDTLRVFAVPDGAVDGFKIVQENAADAQKNGARVLPYTEAVKIKTNSGKVTGVGVRDRWGQEKFISAPFVINAAGPGTGQVAALAGISLNLILDKGTLLVFNHRLTGCIINHCHKPGDGDILVPHHTVSIYGTTSSVVHDPEEQTAKFDEVQRLLSIGKNFLPSLENARILRAFGGIRPLFQPGKTQTGGQGRAVTRNFFVLDHGEIDGLEGLISIVGGKFTTYRLMAEKTVDLLAKKIGNTVPCTTAGRPLAHDDFPEETDQEISRKDIICECESVTEKALKESIAGKERITLNDLRRRTRLGMGTCQGTFCTYRGLEILHQTRIFRENETKELITDMVNERWQGMQAVLWGENIKEAELMRSVYSDILNTEGLGDEDGII